MDDTLFRNYFANPSHTYQRQYEALRAVFVDKRCQKEVARSFGYSYDSFRQLVMQFRRDCRAGESPFFEGSQ